jgi:hypothetical protein
MFEFLRRKKQGVSFSPKEQLSKLTEMSQPSTIAYLQRGDDPDELDNLGKAFFLRQEKRLYSEGKHLYLTTPENLKIAREQGLNTKRVVLQFFHHRVPHTLECRIVGRFRLPPEVAATLDFTVKAAFKLLPTGKIKRDEKRTYKRYTMQNYGDSRVPLTTHVGFDLYLQSTNHEFPEKGAPPPLLNDLQTKPFNIGETPPMFTTRDAINQFRDCMMDKQAHERHIHLSKVVKDNSSGKIRKADVEYLLGDVNVLALEMESLRDVLYLKKSTKSGAKRGNENPYNLYSNEKILAHFNHRAQYYEMLCEVIEARTQNDVVRPMEYFREDAGIHLEIVDYSAGGVLFESSLDFLRYVLGDQYPLDLDAEDNEDEDFSGAHWQKAFEALRRPILHLTFYPKLHFPDAVKEFKPELPFKYSLLGQIVRTHVRRLPDHKVVLQHGLQFAYEANGIPLEPGEIVPWRYTLLKKDNEHFVKIHTNLSQLYGYLENKSLAQPRRRSTPS